MPSYLQYILRYIRVVSGQLSPRKITSRLGLGFGLRLGLVLELGANFPRGQLS